MTKERRFEAEPPFELKSWRDLTPMNVSVRTMLHNKTGSWRFIKPVYEDKTPACQNSCPAGSDIEGWIKLAEQGRFEEACQHLKREQPFPAILGRVCFKFCEKSCNRHSLDSYVGINELELFIGDRTANLIPPLPDYHGKTICIVGSGPAGMSAAYFSRLLGFRVTVFEALPQLGGILRVGIPEYRLPGDVINREFELLGQMGIEFKVETAIGSDIQLAELQDQFDYLFLATGVHRSRKLEIEGETDSQKVMSGLGMLRHLALGGTVDLGRRVIVVGGGNTAIDAARTALRLGAEVTVVYRRTENEMPASPEEVDEARQEGVEFKFLAAPEKIELAADGSITALVCCEMELGPPDTDGRRSPRKKPGMLFNMPVDNIITAIGEMPDFGYLDTYVETGRGTVTVENNLEARPADNNRAKIFAGGDIIDIPHTVVHAVASGKMAAIAIDCDRKNLEFSVVQPGITVGNQGALSFSKYTGLDPVNPVRQQLKNVVESNRMVYHYFEHVPPAKGESHALSRESASFKPYRTVYTEDEVGHETSRCLHCGRCTECDNCLIFCPDISVLRRQDGEFGYQFDYDYCKGCGICATECPRHAITMVDEAISAEEEALEK